MRCDKEKCTYYNHLMDMHCEAGEDTEYAEECIGNNYCNYEPRNLAKPNVKPQLCDSLPDDKEIEFVASDESNGIDFNDLRYRSVWEEGFIKGAEWMKTRVK